MSNRLEELIGVTFQDRRLIESAFVHRSFMHEHPERIPQLSSNERLEFLGDAVLNFLAASWLYLRYPERSEGELTALRAALVQTTTLADFARELGLGPYIRISRGEDTPRARNRAPLLADVFEAVLGAIFLDQGMAAAQAFVTPFFERRIDAVSNGLVSVDHRTRLQKQAQAQSGHTPCYRLIAVSGPDHEREFTMEVSVGDQVVGVGSGSNKQAAAQAAAQAALERVNPASEPQP